MLKKQERFALERTSSLPANAVEALFPRFAVCLFVWYLKRFLRVADFCQQNLKIGESGFLILYHLAVHFYLHLAFFVGVLKDAMISFT